MAIRAFHAEVRRSIVQSLGRFLAIAVIVALGAGFFAGLRMTSVDMHLSADTFYDETNFSDIRVASTLGVDEEELQMLAATEGVEAVQPQREADSYAEANGARYVVRFEDIQGDGSGMAGPSPSSINRPQLVEGAWPTNADECVVSADAVLDVPLEVGGTLTLQAAPDNSSSSDTLASKEFVIVGKVRSPYYVSTTSFGTTELGDGRVDTYAFVAQDAFDESQPYTGAYLTVAGARDLLYPSDAYDAVVDPVVARLEDAADDFKESRLSAVKGKAQRELDDKRADFEREKADAEDKLDDARQKLEAAKRQLDSSKAQLDASAEQLSQSRAQLASAKAQLDANAADIAQARTQVAAGRNQLDEARAKLDALVAAGMATHEQLASQYAELDAQAAQLDAAQQRIAEYDKAYAAYEEGTAKLEAGQRRYDEGIAQYEAGLESYEQGRAEYEANLSKAQSEFADAARKLDDAQADIDAIESPSWYVLDRSKNVGAQSHISDAERIERIAQVFPLIFFLVAALVALTTMTRMVEEERVLIGTHKALGYRNATIISKYFVYAFVASAAGAVVGIGVFSQLLPSLIIRAYGTIYAIPVVVTPLDIPIALASFGLGVGITVGTTWLAAAATLRESPAALMLPRAPKPGKRILLERIGPLWRRLSFTGKVTARNLFRYKRRFFMAVIGIAGCTALLLTGLGLHDGINDILGKQFGELLHYNMTVQVDKDQTNAESDATLETIGQSPLVERMTAVQMEPAIVRSANSDKDERATTVVPQDAAELPEYVTLRTRQGHEPLYLGDEGAFVSEKLASQLGVGVGDTIEVFEQNSVGDATGEGHPVKVAGVAEYYTGQYVYLTPGCYETAYGEAPVFTSYLAAAPGTLEQRTGLQNQLLDIGHVQVVSYYDEVVGTYQKMLETVDSVVWILVVAAAALAFVVLYNLTNINITERIREIATLKVLGFTPAEVSAYIFRETFLLTLFGALLGCVLGVGMESFVITTAEVDQMMFGREIHLLSFAIAFVLTLAFSLLVMLFMKRKLDRVDMVESLKSVE